MKNIIVLDTETTGVGEHPFTYDVGYVIYDIESNKVLEGDSSIIEQIWHNLPLFKSAYYADKRQIYVGKMRGKTSTLRKFGHAMQRLAHRIEKYDVQAVFAYNSDFDERVINFNCDYFKCINPLDNVPIIDIRGHVMNKIAFTDGYKQFCEENQLFTESGNYSTTAENVYRYLTQNTGFIEEHTGLEDAKIELGILYACCELLGADWLTQYKCYRSVPRKSGKPVKVKIGNEVVFDGLCEKVYLGKKRGNYNFTPLTEEE